MNQTPLTVAAVDSVGSDSITLTFETPADFDASPGQFVKLAFETDDGEQSRFYTISSPDVEDTFEITVEIDPDGEVGPLLAELDAGDAVDVAGPFGSSYYEHEERVVVLAGGPGVGPAIGIGERAITDGNEAAVVYRDSDPIHQERLEALSDAGAFVRIVADDEDMSESVADAIEAVGGDAQVFVYGFADFLDAATSAIEAAGGEPDEAKVENFG
jgi:3-phenylpropionate/trans-cinnamate dioxygenase ferredoxin reductase subunit